MRMLLLLAIFGAELAHSTPALADEAKEREDAKKAVMLMEMGVTTGAAFAPQFLGDGTAGVSALPYVLVMPMYWGDSPEANRYCANLWGGGEFDADAAATARARQWARHVVDTAKAYGKQPMQAEGNNFLKDGHWDKNRGANSSRVFLESYFSETPEGRRDAARTALLLSQGTSDAEEAAITVLADSRWKTGVKAKCGSKRFVGVWLGRPTDIVNKQGVVSFGYGISPSAYFSLLAGLSAFSDSDNKHVTWGGTVAVGGNLDIVTGLLRGVGVVP